MLLALAIFVLWLVVVVFALALGATAARADAAMERYHREELAFKEKKAAA